MQNKLTVFQQGVVKSEILDYLRTEKRLDQAINEKDVLSTNYLSDKVKRIFDKLTLNYPVSKDWLMEQINHNSENKILRTGGPATFKSI